MKTASLIAATAATLLVACQHTTQRVDRFDNVRIQQMEANLITRGVFEKVVVCLNARREIRSGGDTDTFLLLEHTPIADFTPAPGESFTLLIDGARHSFAPTNTVAAVVSRPGFTTLAFRTAPQLFVDLANASHVEVRLRGTQSVLERRLPRASIAEFKAYLLKYFQSPPTPPDAPTVRNQRKA